MIVPGSAFIPSAQNNEPWEIICPGGTLLLYASLIDSITDNKGHTISASGTPSAGSEGTTFNGSNYLYIDHADFALGSSHYTIEFYVKFTVTTGARYIFGNVAGTFLWVDINGTSTGNLTMYAHSSSSTFEAFSADTWYHVAWVRDVTSARAYLNGTKILTVDTPSSLGGQKWEIGRAPTLSGSAAGLVGLIKHLRIVSGCAMYDADFTPPTF